MNEIKCIFCHTESNNVVIEENGFKGKQCPQCGLIYMTPRPSFDETIDLYSHDNAHVSAKTHISAELSNILRARHHLKIIRSAVKNGSLLEIGAGAGYFLDEARKVGFDPYGLELNPIQADFIRNILHIPTEESPLNTSVFEGKKFDVVYHCDVISHLFDPISDFERINYMMKDDSYLIFETGNLGEVRHDYFKFFQSFGYPDHLFFFNTDNLNDLLEKTGFQCIKIYRYSILPQLMAIKTLIGVRNSIRRCVLKASEQDKRTSDVVSLPEQYRTILKSLNAESILKRSARNAYQYFHHILRYNIGSIAPKKNRPQTIIIIAKKIKQIHQTVGILK